MMPHQQFYDGPANWLGSEIKDSDEWHFNLTATHVDEIRHAVQKSIDDGIDIIDLDTQCFELPTLGSLDFEQVE